MINLEDLTGRNKVAKQQEINRRADEIGNTCGAIGIPVGAGLQFASFWYMFNETQTLSDSFSSAAILMLYLGGAGALGGAALGFITSYTLYKTYRKLLG